MRAEAVSTFVFASLAIVVVTVAAQPRWERNSSTAGNSPTPNDGSQQTWRFTADFDGDGDLGLLMKPYNHHAPRVDVWLNE